MKKTFCLILMIAFSLCAFPHAAWADTQTEVKALLQKTEQQGKIIEQQQETIQQLLKRMTDLEEKLGAKPEAGPPTAAAPARVSLEEKELSSVPEASQQNVLGRPWYQNIHISGFGAGGFVVTGGKAAKQHGSFLNYEATLNFDAKVWENIHYFHEIQTVRLGDEDTKFARTAEVYVHFNDVLKTLFGMEGKGVGLKIGRMDIPFGEDYLTQDIIDNPLITLSAGYPYGWDEGILIYSRVGQDKKKLNWIFAVMDGQDARSTDDTKAKFLSLKLYGNPTEHLYLSASGFYNGKSSKSAWEFGGSHFQPFGTGGLNSSQGSTGSGTINAYSYELDAKYEFGYDRYLKAQWGYGLADDDNPIFDRNIYYFQIEPNWNLGPRFDNKWYLVSRASAIGTFNDKKGFAFDGKPFASGNSAFGYDTKALYRYALGVGYKPNPNTLMKLEYSKDDFSLIDASPKDGGSNGRDLVGFITAVKF